MFKENPVWQKIFIFSLILFFIRLADSIISFWAPNQIQESLGNPIIMGAIIGLQSVVGLLADLVFPKIFRTITARRLAFFAIVISALTSLSLTAGFYLPYVAVFVITMILWGIYYELINFANFQFMGSAVPTHIRTAAWGFTGIFLSLAYFLGPFIASAALLHGIFITQGSIIIFLLAAFVLLSLTKKTHEAVAFQPVDFSDLNPLSEFKHWLTLSEYIWPIIIISLVLGFIDSTFYTIGSVWTEKLAHINPWGIWFLPLYLLPSICLGIPLSQWQIESGKKKLSEKFMALAGIILAGIAFSDSLPWQLTIVCLSSSALAICYPLLNGVYCDMIARMGREKKDMIGLTNSVTNLSYIVWPIFAGLLTSRVGERLTFAWVGIGVFVVAVILLFITPKKLKLPQEEIKSWE
ncbi:MAG TPA: MFS transporter [Patescibacteria group bacterium]|nr:MFS transporter [Patescibacteria group bacterium]